MALLFKVFLIEDNEKKLINSGIELKCTSLIDNQKTPHLIGCPEIDAFMWVTKDEAHKMVFPSQKILFE